MLNRLSGKICHIDFGDCFEVRMWYSLCSAECLKIIDESFSILFKVAMTREKFPEKIPFRLTRMLTNAMEVRK